MYVNKICKALDHKPINMNMIVVEDFNMPLQLLQRSTRKGISKISKALNEKLEESGLMDFRAFQSQKAV